MVEPFDPDEPEAEDPFAARPGTGYRIGARLAEPPGARAARWRTLGFIGVAAAIAVAALGPRDRPLTDPGPTAATSPTLPAPLVGTPLPSLQEFGWSASRARPFPVFAGGLRWLDPASGTISGDPFDAPRGWLYVAADGSTLCACLDSPWSDTAAVEQIDIRHFDPAGQSLAGTDGVLRLESTIRATDSIVRDVALAPDRSRLYLAYAVRGPDGWTIGATSTGIDGDGAAPTTLELGTLPEPPGQRLLVLPTLRVSPGGTHLMATIRWRLRSASTPPSAKPWHERTWQIDVDGERLSVARATDDADTDAPDQCDAEGWATDEEYVLLCRIGSADSVVPLARVVGPDGSVRATEVGEPLGPDSVDWLVDLTAGAIYRWSPFSHIIARMDVRSGAVVSRSIGSNQDEIAAASPEATESTTLPRAVRWTRFGDGQGFGPGARLVGSPDGTLLYAIGLRASGPEWPEGPDLASTGVWLFDPTDLRVVGHWRAVAMYDQIAVTPDGRALVATGTPGSDGAGGPTQWGYPLALHDVTDGHVAELIGDTVGTDGFTPVLLLPGGP